MIRNNDIWDKVKVIFVVNKMRKARPRWSGHVKRRSIDVLKRRYERLAMVDLRRGRHKSKKYWRKMIR